MISPNFMVHQFCLLLISEDARIFEWIAHNNAVFDICWIKVTSVLQSCIHSFKMLFCNLIDWWWINWLLLSWIVYFLGWCLKLVYNYLQEDTQILTASGDQTVSHCFAIDLLLLATTTLNWLIWMIFVYCCFCFVLFLSLDAAC